MTFWDFVDKNGFGCFLFGVIGLVALTIMVTEIAGAWARRKS